MSITFHSLWLLLTVLCTAGIRGDRVWYDCPEKGVDTSRDGIQALCRAAEQFRGLSQTVTSAVETSATASSKAFEAKVQAEEAVELAESKGLNVTKAKEAAVRATLAAEAAATAASNVEINAANIAAVPWSQPSSDAGLQKLALCENIDKSLRQLASECSKRAENVTAQSLSEALEGLRKLRYNDVYVKEILEREDVEFHKEFMWLQHHLREAVHARKQAEDAAAEANEIAGTNTGPVGSSVASPEGSVLLLMAGLFLSSLL
uniref:Alanine-rich protein n=1 Tax=Trypanosoma brucei TaxID=5691 RepID=Q306G3_9TRYP|nr:alanine-rich protein [Trypanosoma brucei]